MQDTRETPTAAARWQTIGDRAPLGIAVTSGADHRLEYANSCFARLIESSPQDLCGRTIADVLPARLSDVVARLLDGVLETGDAVHDVTISSAAAGGEGRRFRACAWQAEGGHALVLTLDVAEDAEADRDRETRLSDEIREVNARLVHAAMREEELAERAQAASRAKSDFLAVVSHELRTPLTAVIGYTDLLQSGMGALNDKAAVWAERIRFSAWHLREIVDDLISTAVEQVAHEPVVAEPISAAAVAQEAVALVEPGAREKGLEVRVSIPDLHDTLYTDARKVRQVLTNLLFNAVKFTDVGFIDLTLESSDAGAVFHVRDSGIGIPEADLERIFEPFVQVDPSSTRRFGGCGLGLGLSRRFARELGGELTVMSSLGHGSTFTLWVPSLTGAAADTDSATRRLIRGRSGNGLRTGSA